MKQPEKPKKIKSVCSKCNGPLGEYLGKQRYCRNCHNKWRREHPTPYKPQAGLYARLSSKTKQQGIARSYANVYLKRGKLKKQPCAVCGSEKSQMHHEDYTKPLLVRWLCRKHHLELHNRIAIEQ